MSNQPERKPPSQKAHHAGRDIIQVGRNYIQNIQYNFTSGNWITGIILLLPLGLISGLLLSLVLTVRSAFVYGDFIGNELLNQGNLHVFSGDRKLTLMSGNQGAKSHVYVSFLAQDIPLSEYRQGSVHIGKGSGVTGLLYILDSNSPANYQLNTVGTDLTLSLDKNPLTVGDFMQGRLRGKVTDGNKSKQVDLQIIVPVQ